jgi:hypothetical protein
VYFERNPNGLTTGVNSISSFCFITKYIKDEEHLNFLKGYLKTLYQKEQTFYDNSLQIGSIGILEEINSD